MTLLQLQDIMGSRIEKALETGLTPEERQQENEQTRLIVGIGKQMINNADMMLRYEKLQAQNKNLIHSELQNVIGY